MQYRDFEFYLSENNEIERFNENTRKVDTHKGYFCEIYRVQDDDMRYPLDTFCLAADIDIPGMSENAAIEVVQARIDQNYDRLMEEAAIPMERFIKINGVVFSFDEVAKALGFECAPGDGPVQLHLCQRVQDGVLVVKGASYDCVEYPGIDVELQLPSEKETMPVMITRTEQPLLEGEDHAVRTFGYDRTDQYFMYFDSDTRSDAVVDVDTNAPRVTLSGNPPFAVEVFSENPYVKYLGELPVQEQTVEPEQKNVDLAVGMRGTIKEVPGIKKRLWGKPFVVVALGDTENTAVCKIDGKTGKYTIHISEMENLKVPSAALDGQAVMANYLIQEAFAELEGYPDWMYSDEETVLDCLRDMFDRFDKGQMAAIQKAAEYVADEVRNGLYCDKFNCYDVIHNDGPYPIDITILVDSSLSAQEMEARWAGIKEEYEMATYGFANPDGRLSAAQMVNYYEELHPEYDGGNVQKADAGRSGDMKYFEIFVEHPHGEFDYSIFVDGVLNENEAVEKAVAECLFEEPEHAGFIDSVGEISREVFAKATGNWGLLGGKDSGALEEKVNAARTVAALQGKDDKDCRSEAQKDRY